MSKKTDKDSFEELEELLDTILLRAMKLATKFLKRVGL